MVEIHCPLSQDVGEGLTLKYAQAHTINLDSSGASILIVLFAAKVLARDADMPTHQPPMFILFR